MGRRKKGLKEKIKEKLPGGHSKVESGQHPGQEGPEHEKKGIMEKIKEKLPGHHKEKNDLSLSLSPCYPIFLISSN